MTRPTDLAALVLAAGEGRRLRPLTLVRPKSLCPINNVALLDLAIEEVTHLLGTLTPDRVAVNAHHLGEQVVAHVAGSAHVSFERPRALGTAGAVGRLREWVDGRDLLIRNSDVWRGALPPASFVEGWDGNGPRLLVVEDPAHADFGGRLRFAGLSLLPWSDAARLAPTPAGLYEAVWASAERDGRLQLVASEAPYVDCGTPADYLRANLAASGGRSVIGPRAVVDGEVVRCVVWPDAVVRRGEHLVECIRVGADLTVDASALLWQPH